MDAVRIREARRRLYRAWIYGGLLWSVFFIGIAALIAWLIGVDAASELSTFLTLALLLAFSAWGLIYVGAILLHVAKRVWSRQPIVEQE